MADLSDQLVRLVRDELQLARLELTQAARHAGLGIGLLGAAGIAALCFGGPQLNNAARADELADDIAQARQDLGDTIGALSEKLDVKAQAKQAAREAAQRAQEQSHEVLAWLGAAGTAARSVVTDQQGKPKPWARTGAALLLTGGVLGSVVAAIRRRRPSPTTRGGAST